MIDSSHPAGGVEAGRDDARPMRGVAVRVLLAQLLVLLGLWAFQQYFAGG